MFRDLPRWWRKPCLNCEELSQYFLHQFQISGEVAGCVLYLQVENIAAWEAPNEGGIGRTGGPSGLIWQSALESRRSNNQRFEPAELAL